MTAYDISESFTKFFNEINKCDLTRDSKLTYEFIQKIAFCHRDYEQDSIITTLLDDDLYFDGVDYRQYVENLMGKDAEFNFDLQGAKVLYLYDNLKLLVEYIDENKEF